MDSQHVKATKRLLKNARQYFFHIFWWLLKKISSKSSVFVVSEILTLFVNILTLDEKYSLSVKVSVYRKQFKWYYLKIQKYFLNFCCITRIDIKFRILWERRWVSEVICFWNYRLQKAELLKSLKRAVSERLWIVNMLKGPKDRLKMHGSIFFIFFDHS